MIGNPILRGHGISEQDTPTSRHVAVINQAFARKFFKNEDPIGKHFGPELGASRQYEIVGIARDARYLNFQLDKPIGAFFFLPEAQHDFSLKGAFTELSPGSHALHDIVIATRPGANLSSAQVRHAMASIDPNLPIISIPRPPLRNTRKSVILIRYTNFLSAVMQHWFFAAPNSEFVW